MDCGCFDGSTAFRFAAWCAQGGYSYKKIICFEPDDQSFEKCNQILSTIKNCELYKCGLSDKKGKVAFYSNGHEDARIVSDSDSRNMGEIEVINLDSFIDEDISFIKMDIEGAELDALKGAVNIIRTKKPRLAISIYHKSDDIIKIPEFLLELNPDYSFKLRHYSLLGNETVLYAE